MMDLRRTRPHPLLSELTRDLSCSSPMPWLRKDVEGQRRGATPDTGEKGRVGVG
jgi:hypothetical protein